MSKSVPARVMKASDRKKWVAALLSGKYKQGRGRLRSVEYPLYDKAVTSHCCLGVASECLTGKPPRLETSLLRPNRFGLSKDLQQALADTNDDGVKCSKPMFRELGYPEAPKGKTFAKLAAWIDKYL